MQPENKPWAPKPFNPMANATAKPFMSNSTPKPFSPVTNTAPKPFSPTTQKPVEPTANATPKPFGVGKLQVRAHWCFHIKF